MGKMGLGYGSEYQLLRFLGHHQHKLKDEISKVISFNEYEFDWLDYPKNPKSVSFDGEYKGIDFFPDNIKANLAVAFANYFPKSNIHPDWDGIIHCHPMNGTEQWVIVEAKAHLGELIGQCKAKGSKSINMIDTAFKDTQKNFGINPPYDWRVNNNYYQLANRLAVVNFLLEHNIETRLLYVYFLNGWPNNQQKNVTGRQAWDNAIAAEYKYLGIDNPVNPKYKIDDYISKIFVDCNL